ncbi:HlyD family type I secretion periplasmic adaptor subunit [Azospirillum doebereinerae]|uniref:HlyD family type I secretion periplasmic adaptor subunit n=1 Tax=Azospirillum doebereinerae TaxID=92933 RepID=UPI001EE59993|nr:HlyD family type I secretion periplasmic adaptor subunit [Azospirillum doebereinerae]MCG5240585.1 HlyD family type I secretion periplasmic adaptor subunit [Azospirillum doebereinerae]
MKPFPALLRKPATASAPALSIGPALVPSLPSAASPPGGEPEGRFGDGLFAVSFAALAVAVGWAAFAELNVTSSAPGDVVPLAYNQSVQHFEGGIVRDILIQEGDSVQAGQVLVELDQTKTRADLEELRLRLGSLSADIARLEAEVARRDSITFPEALLREKPELVAQTRDLFRARRERLASDMDIQRQDALQREQQVVAVKARIAGSQVAQNLIREQLDISETLLKREITNRMKHLEILRDDARVTGSIAEDRATLAQAEAALAEARSKQVWIGRKYEEESRSALDEARRNHAELSQRLTRYQDSLDRSTMRAPLDGIVKTLAVSTKGAVVKAGETVVELVPRDGKLVVDARLPVQDIGYVRADQPVVVTLAGSDASRFGHIEGRVRTISPDTLLDANKQSYYKVRVELPVTSFAYGGKTYELFPGVRVTCSILTGRRTILDYVFSPVLNGLQHAMQER